MKIGLTGGVGCGVTEAADRLRQKGIPVISGDETGWEALKIPEVRSSLVERFGREILGQGGEIDRGILGEIVFSDPEALQSLNEIIHPILLGLLVEKVRKEEAESGVVVVDAALIFEWDLQRFFDKIIVITAPLEVRISRTTARSGLSREQVMQRIAAQMPLEEKAKRADFVIPNDGTKEELYRKVEEIWKQINPGR